MLSFVKKLSFKYDRPLILKSPGNTARIKTLLELFPDARFVHIHRNPHDVFRSSLLDAGDRGLELLQRPDHRTDEEVVIRQYREVYSAFFAERLIHDNRFHEIAFEDIEADPIGQMHSVRSTQAPRFLPRGARARRYVESRSPPTGKELVPRAAGGHEPGWLTSGSDHVRGVGLRNVSRSRRPRRLVPPAQLAGAFGPRVTSVISSRDWREVNAPTDSGVRPSSAAEISARGRTRPR